MNKENKRFVWSVKVSDKGQISIPKEAREIFNINTGDTLLIFGDIERGMAIAKCEQYLGFAQSVFEAMGGKTND